MLDIVFVLFFIFISLIYSVFNGIQVIYPLSFGLLLLMLVSIRRGHNIAEVTKMVLKGAKKSILVIKIFVLIGAITALWRVSGTVPFIVYYGIKLMHPKLFVVSAFLLTSLVSFLLGTSFGTVGTIGIVFMVMAKSGNVNINIIAGAIIAGAYFGDRCSPMSSSANLVAAITETEIYKNIRNMLRTTYIPFGISILAYIVLSYINPLSVGGGQIEEEIVRLFNINALVIIPALIIFLLALFRVDVKLSMLISIISSIIIAVFVQHDTILDTIRYTVFGYTIEDKSFFAGIIQGGGIISMLKVALIVLVSSAYSGVIEGTNMLKDAETIIEKIAGRYGTYAAAALTSIVTASFACTQVLAAMLTHQLVKKAYKDSESSNYKIALDIEDSAIVIAPLIPWNIAGAVPIATLSAGTGALIYAVYLYMLPIVRLLRAKK